MISLRARLTFGTLLCALFLSLAAGAALYAYFRASLVAAFDAELMQRAQTLSRLVEIDGGAIELELVEVDPQEFSRAERPDYYQLWDASGRTLARSPLLRGANLPLFVKPGEGAVVGAATLPDGRRGRCAALRFSPRVDAEDSPTSPEPAALSIALARDTLDLDATLRKLLVAMCVVGAGAAAAASALMAWMVGAGLAPARTLSSRIAQIDPAKSATQIGLVGAPAELRPVVQTLNDLLQRVDGAIQREKSLTANIAHELRTPLAGMTTTLEVALSRPRGVDEYRQSMGETLSICRSTSGLVESLLALARLDAQRSSATATMTNLDSLLRHEWAEVQATADARQLQVDWDVAEPLSVCGSHEHLQIVVRNLLNNAVRYTPEGGRIAIEARPTGDGVRFCISNTPPAGAEPDPQRVFDRFYRADPARDAGNGHCGIGLSLCKAIVESHGGAIAARIAPTGEFEIKLRLSKAVPPDSAPR